MTWTDRNQTAPSGAPESSFTLQAVGAIVAAGVLFGLLLLWRPWRVPATTLPTRADWTTSRFIGTPEPPPPFQTHRMYPSLTFHNPLDIALVPGTDRIAVAEQYGRVLTFENKPDVSKADLMVDMHGVVKNWQRIPGCKGFDQIYGLAFDPNYKDNHYVYLCYVLAFDTQTPDTGSRVSRFTVTGDPPTIEPDSERILIEWPAGGHNGGCIKFGKDGDLYISTGDQGNPDPPDPFNAGQNVGDLRAKVLRIDVAHATGDKPYAIPSDNPFVKTQGARGEVWCYGLRNPWRMNFDSQTGRLWIGDVGWELWESVHCAQAGGNYGWSIMEGPNPVHPDGKKGPTPIIPPLLALDHSEAASLTGGTVYRGKKFPDLVGHYICGDWETRRLWDAELIGEDKLKPHRTLAETEQRIVAFGEDADGELMILDYEGGGIYGIEPNPRVNQPSRFPHRLSMTGLFKGDMTPAPGVIPFSVVAPQWLDGAIAQRYVAVPKGGTITWKSDEPKRVFPNGTVLVRTLSLPMVAGDPGSARKIETQILQYDAGKWHAYSYKWNETQTDALLIKDAGEDQTFTISDWSAPGGKREQNWHYSSRAQCMTCHNMWDDYTLAFNDAQLDCAARYGFTTGNQLEMLRQMGVVSGPYSPKPSKDHPQPDPAPSYTLVDPYDPSAPIEDRARSYLHVNCSICHRFGGGGAALFDVRRELSLADTHLINMPPMVGTFGIDDARLICSGDPSRSVLLYRISKTGVGRMPKIGSNVVDDRWVTLAQEWDKQLGSVLGTPPANPSVARSEHADREQLAVLRSGGASKEKIDEAVKHLLSSTSGGLMLANALENGQVANDIRQHVINVAANAKEPMVHDLFERFPTEKEIEEEPAVATAKPEVALPPLGMKPDPAVILAIKGDAARGKDLFAGKGMRVICSSCHYAGDVRIRDFGPDLSHIGSKYDRAALLDNILNPSKTIAEGFTPYIAKRKTDATPISVFILSQNANEVVMKDRTSLQVIHVPRDQVRFRPELVDGKVVSPMPEGLLANVNAQEAADLIEYLYSLK